MMIVLPKIDIWKNHTWFLGLFRKRNFLFKKLQKSYRHPVEDELLGSWTISFNQRETVTLVYKSVFILDSNTVSTVNNSTCRKSLPKVIKWEDCIYGIIWYTLYAARTSKEVLHCTLQIHKGTKHAVLVLLITNENEWTLVREFI